MDWLSFLIGLGIGVTIAHIFVIFFRGLDNIILTPNNISENCPNLNGFGCWMLYIFILLASPIVFLFKVLYLISHAGNNRSRYDGRHSNNYGKSYTTINDVDPKDIYRP